MRFLKALGSAFIILFLILLLSCSVPFDEKTDTITITLNRTAGLTLEDVVSIPAEALKEEITYNQIVIHYTATAETTTDVDVNLYISDDTTADTSKDPDDEDILQATLSPGETISGSTESNKLESILNARQQEFVLGGSVSGIPIGSGDEVIVEMYAQIEGSYALSP